MAIALYNLILYCHITHMKYTNKNKLPSAVVKALLHSDKAQVVQGLRVTTLIDSPRISQLRRQHSKEMVEDVSQMVYRVLGNSIHKLFEEAAEGVNDVVSEERLSHEVNGTMISGAIDYQFEGDNLIDLKDYKSTSVFSVMMGPKVEWERQLNVYAYLVRHSKGLKVGSATVIAVLRDWRQADAERRGDYPKAPILEVPINLWSEEDQDSYVEERVRLHKVAELEDGLVPLPECTDGEMWAANEKWAVHTGPAKRATKLFDTEGEAKTFASKSSKRRVVHRPPVKRRCEQNYCGVSQWCDQYNG